MLVIRLFIIAALLASSVIAALWWNSGTVKAQAVNTIVVQPGSVVTSLSLTGELVNDRTVTITALVDGEITSVAVSEGDRIKQGATLAEQDPVTARALLKKATAEKVIATAGAEDTHI